MLKDTLPAEINPSSKTENWIEATVQFINAQEEAVADFIAECMEKGALGSVEQDAQRQSPPAAASDCEACGRFSSLNVYFPAFIDMEEILNIMEEKTKRVVKTFPGMIAKLIQCRLINKEHWATNWKNTFPSERVTDNFWVIPPWESPSLPENAIPMMLEPGLAFGTGKHITTRHCLRFMEEISRDRGDFPITFLDLGCGSGILSIAAHKLGAKKILGLDIDPDALITARRNLERNELSRTIYLVNGPLECSQGTFDLLVANLTEPILLHYRDLIRAVISNGGYGILSGMLQENRQDIVQNYQKPDFQILAEKTDPEEGWTSLLFRKS